MRITITGGTGSLGSALMRRLAAGGAERIVTLSRDEQKRLALAAEFAWHPHVKVYAGDIRDKGRLRDVFHGCEVVVHAAARKVVSGHNDEPREMLETNVHGTQNVIAAAREAGVGRLLFISSDKAVHAENVYGVSKALAEHLVISENARCWPRGQRMSVIRYGNVLGSTGSVLRVWRQRQADGKPLQISDVRMTRFWVPMPDVVGYVIQAIAQMRGGEVFVPKLRAAPLTLLAEAACPGAMFDDIGIRPGGEKLHEELLSADEVRRTVDSGGEFFVVRPESADAWDPSPWIGAPLPDGFTYRSDTWTGREPWTVEELRRLA